MASHKHHKVFIGLTAVVILIIGMFLGNFLATYLEVIDLEVITIGLIFTSIVLLLIVGGLVLEIKDILQSKKRRK